MLNLSKSNLQKAYHKLESKIGFAEFVKQQAELYGATIDISSDLRNALVDKNLENVKLCYELNPTRFSCYRDFDELCRSSFEIFEFMFKKFDLTESQKSELIKSAIFERNLDIVKYLINDGFDIKYNNCYLVKVSIEYNRTKIFKYFMELDIDIKTNLDSYMYLATGSKEIMKILLSIYEKPYDIGLISTISDKCLKYGEFDVARCIDKFMNDNGVPYSSFDY